MNSFNKLYEQIIQTFDESNTAGDGGVFGGGNTNSTTFNGGFSADTMETGDGRNFYGNPDETPKKSSKKSSKKKSKKKKSKFPWLQRRNLVYN